MKKIGTHMIVIAAAAMAVPAMAQNAGGAGVPALDSDGVGFFKAGELQSLQGAAHPLVPARSALSLSHRDATGNAELHDNFSDILIARQGRVTITTGGTLEGRKAGTAAGEWLGTGVTGGTTRDFGPGDVIYIPAGLPHRMILPAGGTFDYMTVKIPKVETPVVQRQVDNPNLRPLGNR